MKKVLLIIFSGTKNTLKVGEMLKENFESNSLEVKIFEITKPYTKIENLDSYDLIGLGYPIYAFNTPKIFLDYVLSLNFNIKQTIFIFKTSGEPLFLNNSSSHYLIKKLKKKNLNILSETQFLMPYNIIYRYKDNLVKQMYLYSQALAKLLVKNILENKYQFIKYSLFNIFISNLLKVHNIGGKINGRLYHVKKKKCIKCNICINNCPVNNIYLKGEKIKFSGDCTMCMRCSMYCPTNAINIGIINLFKVNKPYKFNLIIKNKDLDGKFINKNTKGYFKLFRKYYQNLDQQFKDANIEC